MIFSSVGSRDCDVGLNKLLSFFSQDLDVLDDEVLPGKGLKPNILEHLFSRRRWRVEEEARVVLVAAEEAQTAFADSLSNLIRRSNGTGFNVNSCEQEIIDRRDAVGQRPALGSTIRIRLGIQFEVKIRCSVDRNRIR